MKTRILLFAAVLAAVILGVFTDAQGQNWNKTEVYAAQIAAGGGWVTVVEIAREASISDEDKPWIFEFFSQGGRTLGLKITFRDGGSLLTSGGTASTSGEVNRWELSSLNGDTSVGWAKFTVPVSDNNEQEVKITVNYQLRDSTGRVLTAVGVSTGPVVMGATLAVLTNDPGKRTGFAVANPNREPTTVRFELWHSLPSGTKLFDNADRVIPPEGQIALFADELFVWKALPGYPSVFAIHSDKPVAITGVRMDDGVLYGIPIMPERIVR